MSYTIDERNLGRQHFLAQCVDPLTLPVLERISPHGIHRVLDLGCGQGNTTRMLANYFKEANVTGVDSDPDLLSHARTQPVNNRVNFQQGDATKLPFPDHAFDIVFTRYLLLHLPDPDLAIREMFRLLRPGGHAVSFEPDCCMDFSYPENPGLRTMTNIFQKLFAHPHIGRQLVHRFRERKPTKIQAGACLGVEHEGKTYKRLYRLTAEAMGPLAHSRGVLTADEYSSLLDHMKNLEGSDETVTIKLPDFWLIATR